MRIASQRGQVALATGFAACLLLAGLTACVRTGTPSPGPGLPTESPSPTPGPTATPVPSLLLIAVEEGFSTAGLAEWAADRGWGVLRSDPEGASALVSETRVDLRAIVSFGADFGGRADQIAAEVAPVVLVEAEGIEPGLRLSTVGEPGARHDQAGFLAGVMVGLAGETGWVGLVEGTGGPFTAIYKGGFVHGLRYGCPKCRLVSLTASEATADGFRGQGVEVVFVPPGLLAAEVAARLAAGGLWLVWIGDDPIENAMLAGRVVFAPDDLVLAALEALVAGEPGAAWPYSIENGGILLADVDPEAISPGRQRRLHEAYDAVAAGNLDIGIDPLTGQER